MAKAASPIRLDKTLMEEASLESSTLHRSTADQVEYWADIGRKVAKLVDPHILLEVQAGLATLIVEKTKPVTLDPDIVFDPLERDRKTGALHLLRLVAFDAKHRLRRQGSWKRLPRWSC